MVILGLLLGVAAAGLSWLSGSSARPTFPGLQGTTNIVFIYWIQDKARPEERFSVAAPADVQRLVSLLRVAPSHYDDEPACLRRFRAWFQKPSGTVIITFHNDCLSLYNASENTCVGWWPMPKEFYAEFYKLARTQAKWEIPEFEAPKP